MRHDWQSVPIPPGLDARPKDPRGFPITFVTLIQADGTPDFTTIDGRKIVECIRDYKCGMCGRRFFEDETNIVAFIGGPLSIENQNFLDPPMHVQCAEYAMQVCPHIAIPTSRYAKPKEGEGRELYQGVHPDRPQKFGMYLVDIGGYQVANHGGQPVFIANKPIEVRWQTDDHPETASLEEG